MFDILPDRDIKMMFAIEPFKLLVTARNIAWAEQKHTLKQVIEWGNERCPHIDNSRGYMTIWRPRRGCAECWQELQEQELQEEVEDEL